MTKIIQSIRGLNDWHGSDSTTLHHIEKVAVDLFTRANYQQVRLPILEKIELFARSIGESTDIVAKEMYSFIDKSEDNLCLRPEGTAGCVRAVIQNGWVQSGQVSRLQYLGPMFRRERPQKGRYRQFTQFGAEVFGSTDIVVDLELIQLTKEWFDALNLLPYLTLKINTIGKAVDRKNYSESLTTYLLPFKDQLDVDSQNRIHSNPLRILDSKSSETQSILVNSPKLMDFLSAESLELFEVIKESLAQLQIPYQVDHSLVRGLDYYNDTVFEWVTDKLGSQSTVCGGGRYDGLVEQLGGKSCSGCGFASGLERILLLMKSVNTTLESTANIYILGEKKLAPQLLKVAQIIRKNNPSKTVICDALLGSFKSQFKRADKSGALIAIIIAEEEVANNSVTVKQLRIENENQSEKMQQQTIAINDLQSLLVKLLG